MPRVSALLGFCFLYAAEATPQDSAACTFVYYANETTREVSAGLNYREIQSWLNSSGYPKKDEVVARLNRDSQEFPATVERETGILSQLAAERRLPQTFIFTNTLARSNHYLHYDGHDPGFSLKRFDAFPSVTDPVLTYSPLAAPASLRHCLSLACNAGNRPNRILLVLKSHGNKEMAMVPRVSMDHRETSAKLIIQALEEPNGPIVREKWARSRGTSKGELMSILRETQGQAQYGVVILEACWSRIADESSIPHNIEALMTVKGFANYSNLDFQKAFDRESGINLEQALRESLPVDFERQTAVEKSLWQSLRDWTSKSPARQAIFFLPLFLLVAVRAIYRRPKYHIEIF